MQSEPQFLAHLDPTTSGQWRFHGLEDHLRAVAALAHDFAQVFDSADWAYLAGLRHDLGKFRQAFQDYIRSNSGYDAHIETAPGRVDHSTAGAIHVGQQLPGGQGGILAYLIAGHHAGLANWYGNLDGRLNATQLLDEALAQAIPDDILNATLTKTTLPKERDLALWMRMLFSCLVDADFLDTEAFYNPRQTAIRASYPAITDLLPTFQTHMQGLTETAPDTPVNRIRAQVLACCQRQAASPPALYTLTVPTGGGKTLSSLAFALEHARQHAKRRIIYAIPFTSIIEQTAGIFQSIFGDAVVEHHSNLDPTQETPRSRLATENWDAPLIVTTNVQLFESLFAARTSRVRKLHNLADSVLILDEAQTLPLEFLEPILHTLDQLQRFFGVTVVLSTATQPAFQPFETMDWSFKGLKTRELMDKPAPAELHQALRRVTVSVPEDLYQPDDWEALANALLDHPSVLCIVDRRDDCRTLWRLLPEDTIHLSALMCGEHRSRTIAEIKQRLNSGEPVRVISTQLIEAGVDVDFPVVYRAIAGLDAIAQAAGRCNREGKLTDLGKVVVFVPPRPAPMGSLRQAQECGRQLLAKGLDDPLAPEHFTAYFRELYWKQGKTGLDKQAIRDLLDARKGGIARQPLVAPCIAFRTAADRFRLIEDTYAPVVVEYGMGADLIRQLEKRGPDRWLLRKLQRFIVNLPRYLHDELRHRGDIRECQGLYVQSTPGMYNNRLGFTAEADTPLLQPDSLVI